VVILPAGQDDKVREKKINPRDLDLDEEEEEENVNTTKGWTEEIERRKLKWWEFLLFQKEVKGMVGRKETDNSEALGGGRVEAEEIGGRERE